MKQTTKKTARKDTRTAGKTARGTNTGKATQRGIIAPKVSGAEYDALARVAEAMNACAWCDNDNTAETVFRDFMWNWFSRHLNYADLSQIVLADIDTGTTGRASRARRDALARSFELHRPEGAQG